MTICLSLRKRVRKLIANSKGFSSVIGTTFMVLVMMFLSTTVFLWTLSQNTMYNEAVRARSQEDADRYNENVVALGGNYSVSGSNVTVKVMLKNAGSIVVQIINLWVLDTDLQRYANKSLNLNLNPGNISLFVESGPLTVTIPGTDPNHNFVSWFVTARGNTIPLEKEQSVVIAQLAQGIGYLAMDFASFKYYEVTGNQLGPPQSGFSIPNNKDIVFSLYLTNLDESRRNINLTAKSCLWLYAAGGANTVTFKIVKVVNQTLMDFYFQILEFGKTTKVFFKGEGTATQLGGSLCGVNLLLYGKIGSDDYGQNIPFVAVYVMKKD